MRKKTVTSKQPADEVIRDIRRATRRHFFAEEKIRIVLEGLRGEESMMGYFFITTELVGMRTIRRFYLTNNYISCLRDLEIRTPI